MTTLAVATQGTKRWFDGASKLETQPSRAFDAIKGQPINERRIHVGQRGLEACSEQLVTRAGGQGR